MSSQPDAIENLEQLRRYVHNTICHHNHLEPNAFPVTERVLVRGGKPCGLYFCVHGPRSVKLTAIWETDRQTVIFYSSTGERQHKAQLATHDLSLSASR